MSDLRMLADLLGEVADRLPRGRSAVKLGREAEAMLAVTLPELTATCDHLFEALADVSPDLSHAMRPRTPVAKRASRQRDVRRKTSGSLE